MHFQLCHTCMHAIIPTRIMRSHLAMRYQTDVCGPVAFRANAFHLHSDISIRMLMSCLSTSDVLTVKPPRTTSHPKHAYAHTHTHARILHSCAASECVCVCVYVRVGGQGGALVGGTTRTAWFHLRAQCQSKLLTHVVTMVTTSRDQLLLLLGWSLPSLSYVKYMIEGIGRFHALIWGYYHCERYRCECSQ